MLLSTLTRFVHPVESRSVTPPLTINFLRNSASQRYHDVPTLRQTSVTDHTQKCRQECKKSCPVVRTGKLCIEVTPESKIAYISERLCIGCGICPKKCPFGAIHIINLPTNLETQVTHRYSANSFKLHRLPMPRPGQVLGLVGTNGIGKSTALKILSGKLKPNLGRYDNPPDWEEILRYFRGSELQSMFLRDQVQKYPTNSK